MTLLCAFGVYWSARASGASILYHSVRYGNGSHMGLSAERPLEETIPRRLTLADKSVRLYPKNFRLCRAAADVGYYAIWDRSSVPHGVTLGEVQTWADRGLALNPHSRRLNYIATEVVAVTSPADALKQWQAYMEWNTWDPFNHYYVVELHARSGRFSEAFKHMEWLKGRKHHDDARMIIRYEWEEQERQMRAYLQERSR